MPSLPTPGADVGVWGGELNTYLSVALAADGTLKVSGASGTPGSIPYIDSSHLLAQDNAGLFYDATHHRIGVGTTSPTAPVSVLVPNATGADAKTGILLDRTYGDLNDSMDIVWGAGAGDAPNRLGRLSMYAYTGGGGAFAFYAQNAGGDGYGQRVMTLSGNGALNLPGYGASMAGFDASGNLLGAGVWATWTPSYQGTNGQPFTPTTNAAHYLVLGKTLFFHVNFTIGALGSAAGFPAFSLPLGLAQATFMNGVGREGAVTGKVLLGVLYGPNYMYAQYYDVSSPLVTGNNIQLSGVIEVQ
jgi:hypothetical protein